MVQEPSRSVTESRRNETARRLFARVALLSLISALAIGLDTPILRQVTSFLLLAVIPGLLCLHVFKINHLDLTSITVLSVALSISFIMLFGLFINSIYPLFGHDTPLSSRSVIISFFAAISLMGAIAYIRNRGTSLPTWGNLRLNSMEKRLLLIPGTFPLLTVLGTHLMNGGHGNVLLLALVFLIFSYVIVLTLNRRVIPGRVYPAAILLMGVSIVLMLALRTSHVVGVDIHEEYRYFQLTVGNGQWQILEDRTLDACLSITILPTVFNAFLSMDSEYLFKLLYPLLFSVSPLIVFIISRKYLGNWWAFAMAFLFISQIRFIDATVAPRNSMGVLFFGASVMVLFINQLSPLSKAALFLVLAISCILSHYSTAYVFFFVLVLTLVCIRFLKVYSDAERLPSSQIESLTWSHTDNNSTLFAPASAWPPKQLTWRAVSIFFAAAFFWYSQITGEAFVQVVDYVAQTLKSLPDLFVIEARSATAETIRGVGFQEQGIARQIEVLCFWFSALFIVVGVLGTLFRYLRSLKPPNRLQDVAPRWLPGIDVQLLLICFSCVSILVASAIVPYLQQYSLIRAYGHLIIVVAIFFAIGAMEMVHLVRVRKIDRWAPLTAIFVLTLLFLSTTGATYQVSGEPKSFALNSRGDDNALYHVYASDVGAALWLNQHKLDLGQYTRWVNEQVVYTDMPGRRFLVSQGNLSLSATASLIDTVEDGFSVHGLVYLRHHAVCERELARSAIDFRDVAEYEHHYRDKNRVYDNGGSTVFK